MSIRNIKGSFVSIGRAIPNCQKPALRLNFEKTKASFKWINMDWTLGKENLLSFKKQLNG